MELEGTMGICEAPVWQCLKYINDDVNNRCHFLLYYFPEEKPHKMLMAFQRLVDFNFFRVDTSRPTLYSFILISVKSLATRGIVSFSNSCKPDWLSFPHILKIARIHDWAQQHFEVLSFSAHLNNPQFITSGRVIKRKICRPRPTGLWAGYAPGYNPAWHYCKEL